MSDTKRGHYFKFERGAWIAEAGQPAQHFAASGLIYAGSITLEQRNELDRLIASFLEHGRDAEIAALRKRAEEAEAKVARLKDGAERWRELVTAYAIECGELSRGLQADDPMWDVLSMLGERFAALDAARKETP